MLLLKWHLPIYLFLLNVNRNFSKDVSKFTCNKNAGHKLAEYTQIAPKLFLETQVKAGEHYRTVIVVLSQEIWPADL